MNYMKNIVGWIGSEDIWKSFNHKAVFLIYDSNPAGNDSDPGKDPCGTPPNFQLYSDITNKYIFLQPCRGKEEHF